MLKNSHYNNKAKRVQTIACEVYSIKISLQGVYNIINKWVKSGNLRDLARNNAQKKLTNDIGVLKINEDLLKNPFMTCLMLKEKLNLVASKKTIRNYINQLGWKKLITKYCQIVSPTNRLKRFTYACCSLVRWYFAYMSIQLYFNATKLQLQLKRR